MNTLFWKGKKIVITGATGFVGHYVVENLLHDRQVKKEQLRLLSSKTHDLRDFIQAKDALRDANIVIHLASNTGGIGYSSVHNASQFRNCMLIDLNVFEAAALEKIKKFVAVSSSVAYPHDAPSPLKEEYLFSGVPAPSAYGYGFAKRNTVILARAYRQEQGLPTIVVIPNNSYGPGETLDPKTSHVIPSLIYKCLTKKILTVWGDGTPIRDFLYIKDFTEGLLLAAEKLESSEPVNIGSGQKTSVKELASIIRRLTNFKGEVMFDTTKPNGQKERIVDITRIQKLTGFQPAWSLEDGLKETVAYIKSQI